MTKNRRNIGIGIVTILIFLFISDAFYTGPFATHGTASNRLTMSLGSVAFVILCTIGAISILAATYFFYRMADSPQRGMTLFDARAVKGRSLFSDSYLNEHGKTMRGYLFAALCWFAGSWLSAVLLAVIVYVMQK
jgi:hypothetical protein